MDTDELTESAYELIKIAQEVCDFIKSEIAASSNEYLNENDFLEGTLGYVKEIADDPAEYLDYWNLLDETDVGEFLLKIEGLMKKIESVLALPIEKRGPISFE